MRRADRDDRLGVARVGDADHAIAVAQALLLGGSVEAAVSGGGYDYRARTDEVIAGLADWSLSTGETVDVVAQGERQVRPVDHRILAVPVQPAYEFDGAKNGELVALARLVEDAEVIEREVAAHAYQGLIAIVWRWPMGGQNAGDMGAMIGPWNLVIPFRM